MKIEEFKNIIRELVRKELAEMANNYEKEEKMCEGEGCLDEKSVPQPYDRKKARKMTKSQVERRRSIGKEMMRDEKKVNMFRKKYGDDWKDYLWAAASAATFRETEK